MAGADVDKVGTPECGKYRGASDACEGDDVAVGSEELAGGTDDKDASGFAVGQAEDGEEPDSGCNPDGDEAGAEEEGEDDACVAIFGDTRENAEVGEVKDDACFTACTRDDTINDDTFGKAVPAVGELVVVVVVNDDAAPGSTG